MHAHQDDHAAMHKRVADMLEAREASPVYVVEDDSTLQVLGERNAAAVTTMYSVVYVTASATFTGATAGYTTLSDTTTSSKTTSTSAVQAAVATSKTTSTAVAAASTKTTSSSVAAVKSSSSAVTSTVVVASSTAKISSSSSSSSTSSSSSSSSVSSTTTSSSSTTTASVVSNAKTSSGMSSGAKGGVAFAFILLILAAAGIAFCCIRRRKEQKKNKQGLERLDDEKTAIHRSGTLTPTIAPSVRSASPAPRLSIRPASRFLPNLAADPEKAAAASAGILINKKQRPDTSNSNDSANPFGAHAQTVDGQSSDSLAKDASATELQGSPVPAPLQSNPTPLPTVSENPVASVLPIVAPAKDNANPAPKNTVHRIQLDFKPTMDDELELKAGDLVRILHEYDDGWALCIRMDRSKQGVCPRTCLSKFPLKPRPTGPPPANANRRPSGAPSQQGQRSVSGPAPRPFVANKSLVPAPLSPSMNSLPMAGQQDRQGRSRAMSSAGAPSQARAMSPGPLRPSPMADPRRRSNSMGQVAMTKSNGPAGPSPLKTDSPLPSSPTVTSVPLRKPVPGQAL